MKVNGTIIITDPCYILNDDDWDSENFNMFSNYLSESTGVGDWSCLVIDSSKKQGLREYQLYKEAQYTKFCQEMAGGSETWYDDYKAAINAYDTEKGVLGEFCADSGMVGVFMLDEIMKYNPSFVVDNCMTIIENFDGSVTIEDSDKDYVIVRGIGNINFESIFEGF